MDAALKVVPCQPPADCTGTEFINELITATALSVKCWLSTANVQNLAARTPRLVFLGSKYLLTLINLFI